MQISEHLYGLIESLLVFGLGRLDHKRLVYYAGDMREHHRRRMYASVYHALSNIRRRNARFCLELFKVKNKLVHADTIYYGRIKIGKFYPHIVSVKNGVFGALFDTFSAQSLDVCESFKHNAEVTVHCRYLSDALIAVHKFVFALYHSYGRIR
ncbi:unknown [Firmicutes bacterium CAG:552]|nr:unknown [Firmicutes bacterium CAG:552]